MSHLRHHPDGPAARPCARPSVPGLTAAFFILAFIAGCSGSDGEASPTPSADCNGQTCAEGESCISYNDVTGNLQFTCGIPCGSSDEPNQGCPEGMGCVTVADGPTECKATTLR